MVQPHLPHLFEKEFIFTCSSAYSYSAGNLSWAQLGQVNQSSRIIFIAALNFIQVSYKRGLIWAHPEKYPSLL